MNFRLCAYSLQDIGQRVSQQDCFYPTFIEPCQFSEIGRDMVYYDGMPHTDDRLFILCDGMGGHDFGEVASQIVTYTMSRSLLRSASIEGEFDDALLQKAVDDAHRKLRERAVDSQNMGTTMAALKFHAHGATIGHVGDSRVYHLRPASEMGPAKILFCTEDHNVRNDLLRGGDAERANSLPVDMRRRLSRSIMASKAEAPEVEIDHITQILPGDIFLLCSDGITDGITDEALCSVLTNPNYGDVERVQRLLRECRDVEDNHSAIIVRVTDVINDAVNVRLPLSEGTVLKSRNYTYHIQKTLGKGSFGITYLANVPVEMKGQLGAIYSGIPVTIKEFVMEGKMKRVGSDLQITSDDEYVKSFAEKFRQEATTLALLTHPNIVQILEVFEANNTIYYSMEYLPDGNLSDYACMRTGLPEKEAIAYIRQIGSALSFIHANSMLHLDVKPDNVMRNGRDSIKLIDFGLAKDFSTDDESAATPAIGTTGFAPLEQTDSKSGGDLSPATDVYSLGATYYKLLVAFTPNDAEDVSRNGLNLQPLKTKKISRKSIEAIQAAMQPDRDKRLQSVEDFLSMLPDLDNESDFIEGDKEKASFPWKIIAFVAAVIIGFILLLLMSTGCSRPAGAAPVGSDSDTSIVADTDTVPRITAICPDDSFAIFLRSLPRKDTAEIVHDYNGQDAGMEHDKYCVIDFPLLSGIEQCADVCMHLRAEYLFSRGRYSEIHFHDINGGDHPYGGGASRSAFKAYLRMIYTMSNTYSMSKEMAEVDSFTDMRPGDVLVIPAQDGGLGHAITIMDVGKDSAGNLYFQAAQGYTPACEPHVIRNNEEPRLSPWFRLDPASTTLSLAGYVFDRNQLMRWR